MPNYVKNVLKFKNVSEEDLEEIAEFIKRKDTAFDFNTLISMPVELLEVPEGGNMLAIQCWSANEYEAFVLKKEKSLSDENFNDLKELGGKYASNKLKYGYLTWYDWSIANWGTKWNAWDCEWVDDKLIFYTAWSAPMPIIEAFAKKFYGITFEHHYADEDLGSNCGVIYYQNGMNFGEWYPENEEALTFARNLWEYSEEDFEEDDDDV